MTSFWQMQNSKKSLNDQVLFSYGAVNTGRPSEGQFQNTYGLQVICRAFDRSSASYEP